MPSQEQLNAQLINPAKKGQLDFVQQAIQGRAIVNSTGHSGRTALIWGANNDQLKIDSTILDRRGSKC